MAQMGWLARQDGYNPDAFDVPLEQSVDSGLMGKLAQTWPARLAKDAWGAVLAPGSALQSTEPITSEQMIKPAADLAGLVTGGSYAKPAMKDASGMGIRAYHSSPHDFDKFDLARIGTGEGAQVYGHGLYFAENPAVSGRGGQYWNQFVQHIPRGPERDAAQLLQKHKLDRSAAIAEAEDVVRQYDDKHSRDMLELLRSDKIVGPRTYEVEINADPAHMLDWDKGLHRQSPEVREALARHLGIKSDVAAMKAHDDALYDALHTTDTKFRMPPSPPPDPSGATIYRDKIGPANVASRQLREAGIPGIKYLDQGSRAAGTGSSNFVVFDPGIIDIMKKYGLAGATAVPVMGSLASEGKYQTEERY